MKIVLCFISLICYCSCVEDNQAAENNWPGHVNSGIPHQDYEDHRHESIERPCSIHDRNCIRHVFAQKFGCAPVHGPAPDPYLVKNLPLELPHCNVTVTLNDPQIKGLNSGDIKVFYINKKTDTLVLEVEFDKLVVYTPHTVATYHRKGKEPDESHDYTMVEFKKFSLTLNIQNIHERHLSKSYVYAYFTDAYPYFEFGPGITDTKDPLLSRINEKWMNEMELSIREAFLVQGPVYMSAYVNSLICDFRHI